MPSQASKKDVSKVKCWGCNKLGHYQKDCPNSKPNSNPGTPRSGKGSSNKGNKGNKGGKGNNQKSKGGKGKKGLRAAEMSEAEEVAETETEQTGDPVSESEAWSEIGDGEEIRLSTFLISTADNKSNNSRHTPQPFCHGRASNVSVCYNYGTPESVDRSLSSVFASELQALSREKRFLQKPLQKRGFSKVCEPCVFLKRRVLPEKPHSPPAHLSERYLQSFCDTEIDIPKIRKIDTGSIEECETCAFQCPSVVPGSPLLPSESSSVGIHSSESCFEGILKSLGLVKILKSLGTFEKVAVSTKKSPLEDCRKQSFCRENFSHSDIQSSSKEVFTSGLHVDSLQSLSGSSKDNPEFLTSPLQSMHVSDVDFTHESVCHLPCTTAFCRKHPEPVIRAEPSHEVKVVLDEQPCEIYEKIPTYQLQPEDHNERGLIDKVNEVGRRSSENLLGALLMTTTQELDLSEWWLVDSGASRSVVSEEFLSGYEISKQRNLPTPLGFSTASGEVMSVSREVQLVVILELFRHGKLSKQKVTIRALVAPVQHNLLAVSQLTRMGWSFTMSNQGNVLQLKDHELYPVMWAGVPWVKVSSSKDSIPESNPKSRKSREFPASFPICRQNQVREHHHQRRLPAHGNAKHLCGAFAEPSS